MEISELKNTIDYEIQVYCMGSVAGLNRSVKISNPVSSVSRVYFCSLILVKV